MKRIKILSLLLLMLAGYTMNAQITVQAKFTSLDLTPGAFSWSRPTDFQEVNGKLFFKATVGPYGDEPWVTDGTVAGTSLLKDIYPGMNGGTKVAVNPTSIASQRLLVTLGKKMLFTASDGTHGTELWITDGTTAGTTMLKDINPMGASSVGNAISPYAVLNGKVIFAANDGVNGEELWITDGTTGGTQLIKNIAPGSTGSYPVSFYEYNGKVLFFASSGSGIKNELWITDGTTVGTIPIRPVSAGADCIGFVKLGTKICFAGSDTVHGSELWITDGTTAGTQMIKDIWPGKRSGCSTQHTMNGVEKQTIVYNGELYFPGVDSIHGRELWATNGTSAGTRLVKDIYLGSGSGFKNDWEQMFEYKGKLYFAVNDSVHGYEPWITDGTTAGTMLWKDIRKGTLGSLPCSFFEYKGMLLMTAFIDTTAQARQLFISDGTASSLKVIKPVGANRMDALYYGNLFTKFNDAIYFQAQYFESDESELWRLDLVQSENVEEVADDSKLKLYPNPASEVLHIELPESQIRVDGTLYIYNNLGQLVLQRKIDTSSTAIPLNGLAKGVYSVRTTVHDKTYTNKFVIE